MCGYDENLPVVDKQWGITYMVDMKVDHSRISQWAPYRQNVLLKLGKKKFIFGDGVTVKNPKEGDVRIEPAEKRAKMHLNETTFMTVPKKKITVLKGYRPYLGKGGSGKFVNQHDEALFSATGGAKNSTILCGHIAKQLWRKLKKL